jgi:hypothetical protein
MAKTKNPDEMIAEAKAAVEQAKADAAIRKETEKANAEIAKIRQRAADDAAMIREKADAKRNAEKAAKREKRRHFSNKLRLMAPLLIVNAAAVYGQISFAYNEIAPDSWNTAARITLAILYAVAVESVSLYVQWHAHDALLLKAYGTSSRLRRASYGIATVVGAMNYSHFADGMMKPTAAAIAFGMMSLLSPWLWGLHTRREQHVQLIAERRVDEAGVEFSSERRKAFPIRSMMAKRWALDNYVTDPREAWEGYNRERALKSAAKRYREEIEKAAIEDDDLSAIPVSPVAVPDDITALSKSDAVKVAFAAVGKYDVKAAVKWLAERGVIVSTAIAYRVRSEMLTAKP